MRACVEETLIESVGWPALLSQLCLLGGAVSIINNEPKIKLFIIMNYCIIVQTFDQIKFEFPLHVFAQNR